MTAAPQLAAMLMATSAALGSLKIVLARRPSQPDVQEIAGRMRLVNRGIEALEREREVH